MLIKEARKRGVCWICHQGPADGPGYPFVLNYGHEHAHEECLRGCGLKGNKGDGYGPGGVEMDDHEGRPECVYCGAHFGEFHKSDCQPGNVVGSGHRPKPPIGLKPRSIHDAQRVEEIVEAMGRYAVCGKPFPAEWIRELSDISKEQSK